MFILECVFHISCVIQKGNEISVNPLDEAPITEYYCIKYTPHVSVVCIM